MHRSASALAAPDILIAAGWRVAVVTAGTSLAGAWRELHGPAAAGLFRRMVSAEAPPVPRAGAAHRSAAPPEATG